MNRWQGVADCESGGNWHINTGNGHYGGLQFSMGTWEAYGGSGMPHQQEAWRQARVAERVRVASGLGDWPQCGATTAEVCTPSPPRGEARLSDGSYRRTIGSAAP